MTLRDRFYTPATAKAILSWRILLGLGVGVVVGAVGAPIWLAVSDATGRQGLTSAGVSARCWQMAQSWCGLEAGWWPWESGADWQGAGLLWQCE